MVAPTWDLMSSPTIGTPASVELLGPLRGAGDEDRQRVDEGDAGVDGALGVELGGVLGAHRQVADEHVDLGLAQRRHDVDRLVVGLGDRLAVVLAEAVEGVAALHGDAGRRHVADLDRVVLAGADGVGEVVADLLGVDVERGDELHVTDVVRAELHVHQAGHPALRVGVLVVLDALDQRRGAVADADDGHAYRTHGVLLHRVHCGETAGGAEAVRAGVSCGVVAGDAGASRRRSSSISSVSQRTSRSTDSSPCRCSSRV